MGIQNAFGIVTIKERGGAMSRDFFIMGVGAFLAVLLIPVAAWAAAGDGPTALDNE